MNTGESAKKLDHSCIFGRDIKWCRHSGKQFHNFLKKKIVTTI